ncbi:MULTISPECIES: sugar phosphate isomerase/epimerase [unclassified Arthrobacter]|uniref:sugar phosphate isomerase/epimerase family protein n=1 Tax=unclassified Arthrobacter TaxID=235627 RepID=UPI001C848FE2|nr:sugar phosphate isomerase/epimerase family protein [Arthrobacter sp. MAHUQ-56]MBX7445949.1 sugar phosphate isomerase/epimerase [Arthrobacter sp. MAHUQ-56]
MEIAIFAKTFEAAGIEENMAAVAAAGITAVQYNLSIAGIDTVPEKVDADTIEKIKSAAATHNVRLAAISGTFNTAHPDPAVRETGLTRFAELVRVSVELGIPVITLCSGSRDPEDMWRFHPDNATPEAWADSRQSLTRLARLAEEAGITVAVEPEHTNVVSTADLAHTMLDEIGSPALKIVFDAANILDTDDLSDATTAGIIDHALKTLGPDIALAHAKELVPGRRALAPGQGALPWQYILSGLSAAGYSGALVMHGLPESEVGSGVAFLRQQLEVTV